NALPLDSLSTQMAELVAQHGLTALQYGSAQGVPQLRERICEIMGLEGITANPDDVVVTVGCQMGLDMLIRLFCEPGDVILAEGPSYVGALGSFASYQAEVAHVSMDDQGLVPEELRSTLRRLHNQGRRVKFLYTHPTFHNTAGVQLAAARQPVTLPVAHVPGCL